MRFSEGLFNIMLIIRVAFRKFYNLLNIMLNKLGGAEKENLIGRERYV